MRVVCRAAKEGVEQEEESKNTTGEKRKENVMESSPLTTSFFCSSV